MRTLPRILGPLALLVLPLGIAACGSSSNNDSSGTSGKNGGTVTILDTAGGVDSLDPGYWYYTTDYEELAQTTQRQLYGWAPKDIDPQPDLAETLPKASNGNKTLTIKIKPNIQYSAPLANQSVKTADIKYGMERCLLPAVGNGYANSYYLGIEGAQAYADGKADEVSGIETPDDTTMVINTIKPVGVLANGNALALPCTVPVPKEYAQKYDKGKASTYGEHQVFTGPYMIDNNGKGDITGYKEGQELNLVRNPSWDKSTDFRPAYFDKINVKGGNDATVAARKTVEGQSLLSGDYAAPPTPVLKSTLASHKDQVKITPSGGNRYISLNTTIKPLDNVNVRRAISAATDRTALRQTRGGPTLGPLATHFIPPGVPGFEEAGGLKGPGYDFVSNPTANLPLAMSYMKKAGYKSGKYSGPPLLTVADNEPPANKTAEAFQNQIEKLGFKLTLREVPHATLQSKYCLVPKAEVAICPTLGWGKDFNDARSMIDPLFNGKNIVESGNVNTAQVNDPKLNKQIEAATEIVDPDKAAQAWGDLDKEVTNQSYFVTWIWDNNVGLESTNVNGVGSLFNSGTWDLTFSSLK